MSSSCGENLKLTIFGQSHSPAIGMTLEGLPAGTEIDMEALNAFLARRAPGQNAWSTARREADLPEFISGLKGNVTCGVPLTAIIRNTDTRSKDYAPFAETPRPGHADYTASVRYHGFQDPAGGGHFSGRMTAPLCIAGGVCLQILKSLGVEVISRIAMIGGIPDRGELLSTTADKAFPTVDDEQGKRMQAAIADAKIAGDSLGGIVECKVLGLPAGLGDPMFDGMENRIAALVFGIPAVKGVEFGAGFALAKMKGSQANDAFRFNREGRVVTETNNCGGILGGISNGMPLIFRAVVKPTPSIARTQRTVDLEKGVNTEIEVQGRHDPCIVPRAVPVIEAVTAIALAQFLPR